MYSSFINIFLFFFFFNDTATTEIYTSIDTLSLHDALPIRSLLPRPLRRLRRDDRSLQCRRSEEHTSELQSPIDISYAVFCLKKKNTTSKRKECRQKHEHRAQSPPDAT